ncbi:MAG: bifunctional proline dehydrogenase/L-glutamate gamma-semialdehyde dehydrogenase [Phycisphaeraceae bacterium]|nr:proline dehydrogenase family protein [Phycisphaerales bacterium]MCB9860358.1 bifunctional proline dehydrogenase/L-glutamate gamma-semialdehyde dehydrogenase [Phycisphaeraceae bacterium]
MGLFSRKSGGGVAVRPTVVRIPTEDGTSNGTASRMPASAPLANAGHGELETSIRKHGEHMLELARDQKYGILSTKFYSDKMMEWSMKDHDFKVQMFRFVDAFPVLRTPEMIYDHLDDYMNQPGVNVPGFIELALKAGGLAKGMAAKTIAGQIESMAGKFIAGEDAKSALGGLAKIWKDGIAFSVDLLGEACVSDAEADMYQQKYLDLVANLPDEVASWKANSTLEQDHLGGIPRTNVSVKISSLSAKCNPIDTEGSIRDIMSRLVPILELARDKGVLINFDMEQFALKDLTLELFKRCCEQVDFQAGIAMQAYLKSGEDDARNICEWAKRTGRVVSVRLVKGAYWDYETIHAEEQGWQCPVWSVKWETDACFERMTRIFLDACPRGDKVASGLGPTKLASGQGGVKLALGSHNVRSIATCLAMLEQRGLPKNAIEIQMLHGMADQLKHAAHEMDLRIREYVPVGEMIPGMAYLVRRLLENTSNESWLKAGFLDNANTDVLLAAPGSLKSHPHSKQDLSEIAAERHHLSPSHPDVGDGRPFFTEPMRDFSQKSVRDTFSKAVKNAVVPSVPSEHTPEQAFEMIAKADAAFPAWRDTDPALRSRVLVDAADILRKRRDEFSGVVIKENGKCWVDADADLCEAIDFLEYYARCAMPLFERERLGRFIGELDEQWHQARGIAAVISPWNFPVAICAGMTSAALVTGNTVILKPAEQTTGCAKIFVDAIYTALRNLGLSTDVLQFCPAPGETTGAAIVRDPRIALIAFTGSKAVGLDIVKAAGVTPEEQLHVKKVVCEMGGKNAIIIDTSADLDEAVLGVRQSAFGFQGQKCSACSRVIVVDPQGENGPAMRAFTDRFVHSTNSLVIGDPIDSGTDIGPVIDQESCARITGMIDIAKREGCTLELEMELPDDIRRRMEAQSVSPLGTMPCDYVTPTIFSGVKEHHTIAKEEIFGPVVAIMHAASFDEALRIANNSQYKLTGGVFSRKPAHIEQAKRGFRVGNLYINRSCTGALVARQPFGGFAMSGVGSKAGGDDYLLQFVEPRACCENTMRRGFAPEL